ncbi:hypothetical protein N0V87_009064 [Didymella glomerata]|uniref:Uncharacterized protein n=1 Tax=Didymella glomerata TaxID=749621 RepID=A0A9W8WS13_9PLEO|nr:hypothetical protein N0V87_009064 [Didymella glomerata]
MPVYHARSITVRLGSMPLGETTTSDVVLKKGEIAKRQGEAAEQKLLRSGYLSERRVLFPGDRDGFELNWLGNAPFMQAQINPGFPQSSGLYANDQTQAHRSAEQYRLQALALHVKLSDKAFLSGFNGKTHLKIEVLFNGQLSTCSLIHTNDIRSGAKSLHQIFAGYRVDFLAERPWVLLSPFTTADGGTRRFRKTITAVERWKEVSAAIQKEAEERGTDKYGESPPSATFLHALASMDMPESVPAMQKPGGRKFGVMDVIITAGYGNKITTGTSYLKRPQRLKDSNYAVRSEIKSDDEAAAAEPDDSQGTTDKIVNETEANIANNEADTMFSVSSKPRRSSSPDKGAAKKELDIPSNTVTVSRLIIKSRDGKPIVDHTWSIPQRIRTAPGGRTLGEGQAKQATLQQRRSLADPWARERDSPPNHSFLSVSRAVSPANLPNVEGTEKYTDEQRRDSVVEPTLGLRLPYLKRHQGPANEIPPVNHRIDVPDSIAPFVPAHVLAMAASTLVPTPVHTPRSASPVQPTVSRRRTFLRNPLPGIQGPKAATFLFDDPEEVLREAARMRRSRSPTKPAATPIVLPTTPTLYEGLKANQDAYGSSSPLSSAPSSPLCEQPADVLNTANAAPIQVPQLDGSPERTLPATSPRKLLTPSPKKLSLATPKLQRPDPVTPHPQVSISPNAKKRKASQLSPARPPRSPDRLKTVNNPALNDDCVIALAESVDKHEERGVLRQVKGERQGMFKEEYVVLAVRFFVAGD